ncbi:MAG: hypothetical protein QXD69_04875, partial [Candidatus Bathyarchaeia archaeon]
ADNAWCRRLSEAIALKSGRGLRRKKLVCEGCVFSSKGISGRRSLGMEKSGLEQITQDFISAIPSSHFSCPSYSASS